MIAKGYPLVKIAIWAMFPYTRAQRTIHWFAYGIEYPVFPTHPNCRSTTRSLKFPQ